MIAALLALAATVAPPRGDDPVHALAVLVRGEVPVHEGKTAVEWISALDAADPSAAIAALKAIGEPAVPFLIAALRDARPLVPRGAARALGEMGNASRKAAEPLAQTFIAATDEELAWTCSRALAPFQSNGKPAVGPLARAVADTQASVALRCLAAITLGSLGPHAKDAVPEMMACFEEAPTTLVHPVVALELGRIGKAAALQLDNELAKQKQIVGLWRIVALASAGEEALSASNALVPLVETDEWIIHPAVHYALERMGGRAKPAREKARRDEEQREKGMRKGGLIDNTLIEQPHYLRDFFRKLGVDDQLPVWLPEKLSADKKNFNAGDMLEALSEQYMLKLDACRKKLEEGAVRSHAELETLFYGVPGLGEGLRRVTEAKNMNLRLWPK